MSRQRIHRRRQPGRPIPLRRYPSEAQKDIFLERFEECLNPLTARKHANITKKQFDELMETDLIFVAQVQAITSKAPDRAELRLFETGIVDGHVEANKAILAAYKPERYGRATKIEISSSLREMSLEDLEALVTRNERQLAK